MLFNVDVFLCVCVVLICFSDLFRTISLYLSHCTKPRVRNYFTRYSAIKNYASSS